MRRALQDGHTPRFLHDSATSKSLPHERQRARKKPCAKIPHLKYSRSFSFDVLRQGTLVRLEGFCEKRLEALGDDLVQRRGFRFVQLVAFGRCKRWPLARRVGSHQTTISEPRAR